jgi:hypothetical protein
MNRRGGESGNRGKGDGDKESLLSSVAGSPIPPLSDSVISLCCQASAKRYIKKHRDVAICDTCGMLLLGYGNERDYDETRKALAEQGTPFASVAQGALKVIAKPRVGKTKGRR